MFGPTEAIYSGYTCYTGIADFVPADIETVGYAFSYLCTTFLLFHVLFNWNLYGDSNGQTSLSEGTEYSWDTSNTSFRQMWVQGRCSGTLFMRKHLVVSIAPVVYIIDSECSKCSDLFR